jgi:AraC-like DNA-binding protein
MKTKSNSKRTNSAYRHSIRKLHQTPRTIVAWSEDYPNGHVIGMHRHERAQLLFASMGVMSVTTADGRWVVPPLRAVWVPARTDHQIVCSGKVLMRTLYIKQEKLTKPLPSCSVVSVPPLLRELILYAVDMPCLYDTGGPDGRIERVIMDCIQGLEVAPLDLPAPDDERLKSIQQMLSDNPADQRTLSEWADVVGMTSRTLARHIQKATNLTFGQWRQQIRLLEGLKKLGRKEPVTKVAMDLGYDSPSAFIAMFKKALGSTPGQYFKNTAIKNPGPHSSATLKS